MVINVIEKQVKTSVYLLERQLEQLEKLCGATRIKKAAYFREAIDDLLEKYRETLEQISKQERVAKKRR